MKKINPILTALFIISFSAIGTVIFAVLYRQYKNPVFLTFSVTFLTVFYHFAVRILVGEAVTLICKNRKFNYSAPHLSEKKFEKKLYRFLRVRKWAPKIITAKPWQFDIKKRSPEELLFYMTQAEIVHEVNMILSFVPLLFIIPFGAAAVFTATSVFACLADAVFVIVQRYNRPKVLRHINRLRKNGK